MKAGITIIICCYNSAGRIKETLNALSKQQFRSAIYWEILLIDNACTDNTASLANSLWNAFNKEVKFTVINEPNAGVGHARRTGIAHTSTSHILFCDDDNWLHPGYIQHVYDILCSDPAIAACGGKGVPVFEVTKPDWFDEYQEAFAIGSQEINSEQGRILNLYSAGMGVSRKALQDLDDSGFRPILDGKKGNSIQASSEDTELTYALALIGYRLHYAEDLKFFHYLPKERLTYSYLKKLFRAFGNDGPVRNLYYSYLSNRLFHQYIKNWFFHLTLAFIRMVKYLVLPPKKNGRTIYLAWSMAYIKELYRLKPCYATIKKNISKIKNTSTLSLSLVPFPDSANPIERLNT